MTILRTALASLVIIVAATATAAAKDMWPPPAQYDSGPLLNARFPEAIITHLSPEDLFEACQGKHLACSHVRVGAPCRIFLPLVGGERMVRHEMGHCRGWPGDHRSQARESPRRTFRKVLPPRTLHPARDLGRMRRHA